MKLVYNKPYNDKQVDVLVRVYANQDPSHKETFPRRYYWRLAKYCWEHRNKWKQEV